MTHRSNLAALDRIELLFIALHLPCGAALMSRANVADVLHESFVLGAEEDLPPALTLIVFDVEGLPGDLQVAIRQLLAFAGGTRLTGLSTACLLVCEVRSIGRVRVKLKEKCGCRRQGG